VESSIYSLRFLAQPSEFNSGTHVLLKDLKPIYERNGHTVNMLTHSEAVSLNASSKHITIRKRDQQEHEVLPYDFLVLANGCYYATPYIKPNLNEFVNPDMRKKDFEKFQQQLNSPDNNHVVIVGGGSLGIEMVGELVEMNKSREQPFKITLVHSRSSLKDKVQTELLRGYLMNFMRENGVEVHLGRRARVEQSGCSSDEMNCQVKKTVLLTPSGYSLDKDSTSIDNVSMILWCGGMKPATEWLKDSGVALEESGLVKVNTHLQSINHSSIFSVGDANSVPCEKLASGGSEEGKIAAKNIVLLSEDDNHELVERNFDSVRSSYSLTMGPYDGVVGNHEVIKLSGREAGEKLTQKGRTKMMSIVRK